MSKEARWTIFLGSVALLALLSLLLVSVEGTPEASVEPTPLPALASARRTCADIQALSPVQRPAEGGAPAQPTPTLAAGPAPTEDRIGFPVGYRESFGLYFVVDRPELQEVRVACANVLAATAGPGQPLPYGSVFIMEGWTVAVDERGAPIFDATGHLIREELRSLFVMRKGEGFGEAYGPARTGEWEYVAYRPDGSFLVPPAQTHGCAACHQQQSSAEADWLFRSALFFDPEQAGSVREAGLNEVIAFHYLFRPGTVTVRVGNTVTWSNLDEVWYTVTAADGSFDSGTLAGGQQFSHTFERAGRYDYFSSLHPGMRGTIQVIE